MKTARRALTEWVVNQVHFDAGRGIKVWGQQDFLGLLRFVNGGFRDPGGKFWVGKECQDWVDWKAAEEIRNVLDIEMRGRQVTPLEMVRAGSLKDLPEWVGKVDLQNLKRRQRSQGSQGALKTHKDHIGSLPPQKRAANAKIAATAKAFPKAKPKGPEPTKPTTNPQE